MVELDSAGSMDLPQGVTVETASGLAQPARAHLRSASQPAAVRNVIRMGCYSGQTSGIASGFVQGNLAILPRQLADDFLRFVHLNPKPCPLIGMSEAGSPHVPALGEGIDLRTDVPRYRVWRRGEVIDEPTDIRQYWRDDLVSFVLGCSFSFEEALEEGGILLRHIERGTNVPMFRTNIACTPAGPFSGSMVVSMRPLKPADAIRAVQITSRFPAVHGAPVHIGKPEMIGISDITRPDYGDPVEVLDDELPVFWACGVTPQAVIMAARPEFAITHYPGAMLITDKRNSQLAAL